METKKEKPLDKQTKRDLLQSICNAKGWDIKSDLATSLNRSRGLPLLNPHFLWD